MEVPVINRVGDLQLTIGRLPTLISQFLIEQVPEIFSLCKWGALILAVYAIVNSLLVRFKFELIRLGKHQSAVNKSLLSYSSDDEASVSGSSVNGDEYEYEEEEEEEVKDRNHNPFRTFFDFRVAGSSNFEKDDDQAESNNFLRRFSWSNFANGKSVVELWDGIGLGLDLNSSSGSIVSIHDLNHVKTMPSVFPAATCQPQTPPVILSAGKDHASNFILSLTDTRLGRQSIFANRKASKLFNPTVAAISSCGLQKVYFSDEVGEKVRVVDLRKATECGEMTWFEDCGDDGCWDSDATVNKIIENEIN